MVGIIILLKEIKLDVITNNEIFFLNVTLAVLDLSLLISIAEEGMVV